jgi:mannose-6-phosphate isomerase-like protein (cupin superfamily)
MKIIRLKNVKAIPASHEDPKNPGVLKHVLVQEKDLVRGHIRMINWATLAPGKSFRRHYHEDLQEVFIIVTGDPAIVVDGVRATLHRGDAIIIDKNQKHEMTNNGRKPTVYVAIGLTRIGKGKTIITE